MMFRSIIWLLIFFLSAGPVEAASRFWVGGTGTWDSSTTTHWAATSGGAGGQSVPGSADTVTFDGSSGGGTVTLNFGGLITIQGITMGAFTGTWDNSVNNNNMTMTGASPWSNSGSGTRTVNMGSATYTLTAAVNGVAWDDGTVTGLTLSAASSTIVFSNISSQNARTFNCGSGKTYGTVTLGSNTNTGTTTVANASCTFTNLNITGPGFFQFGNGLTLTVTNVFTLTHTASTAVIVSTNSSFGTATIAAATGSNTLSWTTLRGMTFTGTSVTCNNCLDLQGNSGVTINTPAAAGSGACIITGEALPPLRRLLDGRG